MTHVFVAPHPDDVALSCGGLIASLRELGQNVTIVTAYSGSGSIQRLTPYQREALGFGSKAVWPGTEAFNRAHILPDWPSAPDPSAPPWAADPERLEATQADADTAAPEQAGELALVERDAGDLALDLIAHVGVLGDEPDVRRQRVERAGR
ncbi:MAG TPA: PIG-L family deacetylase, partial [Candidatus Limnocylindrales bacterium]|nr:PIG-L family deacetylase [Candidatus Limnocylindrales bacterium]